MSQNHSLSTLRVIGSQKETFSSIPHTTIVFGQRLQSESSHSFSIALFTFFQLETQKMASYLRELYRDPTNRVTTNSSSPLDMLNDTNASSYPETDMTRDGTYDITTFFLVTVFSMFW